MPKMVIQEGQKQRMFEYEGGRVTFGHESKAVIQLSSPGVSGLHFEITDTPEGFRLKDLTNKQDTLLNGKAIQATYLRDGDTIQAGKAVITFWEQDVPSRPSTILQAKEGGEKRKRATRRPSSTGTNPLLILMLLILVLGLCYLVFNTLFSDVLRFSTLYTKGTEAFNRSDYKAAMDFFSQVDPGNRDYGALAQEKYKEAQIRLAKVEAGGKLSELRKDLDKIYGHIARNKHDQEGNASLLREWIQNNAALSPALAKEAQEELDKVVSGVYSPRETGERRLVPEPEDPTNQKQVPSSPEGELELLLSDVSKISYQLKFKEAIDQLNTFKQKYPLKLKLREQADEKIEAIYEEARVQYQKILQKAQELAQSGKKQEAKSQINQIIDHFGLDFYILQAKEELKKLD